MAEIVSFLHCRRCLEEMPRDISARDFARLEVGLTVDGIQINCVRHDCGVAHVAISNGEIVDEQGLH
jgi:hypothetical protein